MPTFILSGPGSQQTTVECSRLEDAEEAAKRFALRYGIIGEVDIYLEREAESIMRWNNEGDARPVYHFIYCASEQGALSRRCDDDTKARQHAHILADAHGETCYIAKYERWPADYLVEIGQVEPRIPKS